MTQIPPARASNPFDDYKIQHCGRQAILHRLLVFLAGRTGAGGLDRREFPHPAAGTGLPFLDRLRAARMLRPGVNRIAIRQGVEIGRPSDITVTIGYGPDGLGQIRVAGQAVRISEGRIRIPGET